MNEQAIDPSTAGILAGVLVFGLVIIVCNVVAFAITWWRLVGRAGQPRWAIFIPFYNYAVIARAGGLSPWLGVALGALAIPQFFLGDGDQISLGLSGVSLVLFLFIFVRFAQRFRIAYAGWFWAGVLIAPVISVFFAHKVQYISSDLNTS